MKSLLEDDDTCSKKLANKNSKATYLLIDRLVVKEFDEDDMHRIADSVGTAFYEGEGEMYDRDQWR